MPTGARSVGCFDAIVSIAVVVVHACYSLVIPVVRDGIDFSALLFLALWFAAFMTVHPISLIRVIT